MQSPHQRARTLAALLRDTAGRLEDAAAGEPDRLADRRGRGCLDTELACIERDFRRTTPTPTAPTGA